MEVISDPPMICLPPQLAPSIHAPGHTLDLSSSPAAAHHNPVISILLSELRWRSFQPAPSTANSNNPSTHDWTSNPSFPSITFPWSLANAMLSLAPLTSLNPQPITPHPTPPWLWPTLYRLCACTCAAEHGGGKTHKPADWPPLNTLPGNRILVP